MVLPGFNTDFSYGGETYHVQTEDNGLGNPVVVTLLYFKGAILASRRTSYQELLPRPSCQKELMELMKSQHREIMHDLLAGKFDERIGGKAGRPAAAPGASAPPPAVRAAAAARTPPVPQAPLSLDAAICRYLEEHAAAAARSAGRASQVPG